MSVRLDQLEAQNAQLIDQLSRADADITQLRQNIESLQKQLQEMTREKDRYYLLYQASLLTIDDLQGQVDTLTAQNADLQNENQQLQNQNDSLSSRITDLLAAAAQAAATIAGLEATLLAKDNEIIALTASAAALAALAGDRRDLLHEMSPTRGGQVFSATISDTYINSLFDFNNMWSPTYQKRFYRVESLPTLTYPRSYHIFIYRSPTQGFCRILMFYVSTATAANLTQYFGVTVPLLYCFCDTQPFELTTYPYILCDSTNVSGFNLSLIHI